MEPEAICFDMGYTLMRHRHSYGDLLTSLGHAPDPERLESGFRAARELYYRATREGRDFESTMEAAVEFWREYNELILAALDIDPALRPRLSDRISEVAWGPEAWEPFPEVEATLIEPRRRGLKMAVISNFTDTLEAVCELHRLTPYFDTIVCSVKVGAMKPDPRIFQRAVRRLGTDPARTWHVGDNYWADVLGARAAGLVPVLIDRDGAVPRPDCVTIDGLGRLLELLDGEAAA
jgi:HAD superfamily hydrolase (TIGR01509 family)